MHQPNTSQTSQPTRFCVNGWTLCLFPERYFEAEDPDWHKIKHLRGVLCCGARILWYSEGYGGTHYAFAVFWVDKISFSWLTNHGFAVYPFHDLAAMAEKRGQAWDKETKKGLLEVEVEALSQAIVSLAALYHHCSVQLGKLIGDDRDGFATAAPGQLRMNIYSRSGLPIRLRHILIIAKSQLKLLRLIHPYLRSQRMNLGNVALASSCRAVRVLHRSVANASTRLARDVCGPSWPGKSDGSMFWPYASSPEVES